MRKLKATVLCAAVAALAACSEDVPLGDPAGQGAGRPESTGEPVPAAEVLRAGTPATGQDTTGFGTPRDLMRDSLHDGEANPAVTQPTPERPNNPAYEQRPN